MSTYARIEGEVVVEIITVPDGFTIADVYHPDLRCEPCGADVKPGMRFTDGGYSAAPQHEIIALPLEAQYGNHIAAGCRVEAADAALSGTYAIGARDEIGLRLLRFLIDAGEKVEHYRDKDGRKRLLTNEQFKSLSEALLGYIGKLDAWLEDGGTGELPEQPLKLG